MQNYPVPQNDNNNNNGDENKFWKNIPIFAAIIMFFSPSLIFPFLLMAGVTTAIRQSAKVQRQNQARLKANNERRRLNQKQQQEYNAFLSNIPFAALQDVVLFTREHPINTFWCVQRSAPYKSYFNNIISNGVQELVQTDIPEWTADTVLNTPTPEVAPEAYLPPSIPIPELTTEGYLAGQAVTPPPVTVPDITAETYVAGQEVKLELMFEPELKPKKNMAPQANTPAPQPVAPPPPVYSVQTNVQRQTQAPVSSADVRLMANPQQENVLALALSAHHEQMKTLFAGRFRAAHRKLFFEVTLSGYICFFADLFTPNLYLGPAFLRRYIRYISNEMRGYSESDQRYVEMFIASYQSYITVLQDFRDRLQDPEAFIMAYTQLFLRSLELSTVGDVLLMDTAQHTAAILPICEKTLGV